MWRVQGVQALVELQELENLSRQIPSVIDSADKGSIPMIAEHLYKIEKIIGDSIEKCISDFDD